MADLCYGGPLRWRAAPLLNMFHSKCYQDVNNEVFHVRSDNKITTTTNAPFLYSQEKHIILWYKKVYTKNQIMKNMINTFKYISA